MYSRLAIVLLLSCLGMAQPVPAPVSSSSANLNSAPQNSSQPASDQKKEPEDPRAGTGNSDHSKPAAEPSKLPPDAPVITVDGFCDQTAITTVVKDASSGCKTVLTREQFERLVDSIDPNMSATFRQQLALAIPRFLLFSKKAKELGLEKDPRYAQMMKWDSSEVLGNSLNAQLQKKAADVPDAEIEKYYQENSLKFQQCELQRIFIPNDKPDSSDSTDSQKAADKAALKAEAEKIRAKAAAGGDFAALQREAYDDSGITSSPLKVNLGKRTAAGFPQKHHAVFELQPGQVSEVFSDPDGFYIYKVVSKDAVPLSQAKTQIHKTLQSERMKSSLESLFASVTPKLNDTYFGAATPANQEDLAANPAPATESASPSSQTAQTGSSDKDKEWADSPVNSVVDRGSSAPFVGPPESVVPLSAPVITLEGICGDKPATSKDCRTTVSRGDFEAMMNAIDPGAAPNELKRWADQYADSLMRGEKARQLGLDNTDQYKLAMSFMSMDSLFKLLNTVIMDRSRQLTDADLAEFYRQNQGLFEEIKTMRIVIPQYKASPPEKGKPTPEQLAAGHAEMKKEAESVATRAALPGADFQALENEGWKFSGYVEDPPEVPQAPLLRWEMWPRSRLFLFDLKAGEVSPLIDEPTNGFYVYKIVAKREVPLDQGSAYIRKRYAGERFLDTTTRLLATIKTSFDDQYFGRETQQAVATRQPGKENAKTPTLDIKVPKKVEL